jgi:hypothetical protein
MKRLSIIIIISPEDSRGIVGWRVSAVLFGVQESSRSSKLLGAAEQKHTIAWTEFFIRARIEDAASVAFNSNDTAPFRIANVIRRSVFLPQASPGKSSKIQCRSYDVARAVLGHPGWFDITDVVSLAVFLRLATWII